MIVALSNSFAPRWAVMWGVALSIYAACKWLTWVNRKTDPAMTWQHAAYLLAWPGMDVNSFFARQPTGWKTPTASEWMLAFSNTLLGVMLLSITVTLPLAMSNRLQGWAGMIGIVLTLHFGIFHLLSCLWRRAGIDAKPIMNWPVASQSVAEFWGKRWNLAFRDLTHQFVFRPLLQIFSPITALLAGFLISGFVHELVTSLPAGGGWGLPTCYFLIQGFGIAIERTQWGRKFHLNHGLTGRLFCILVVLLPCPLLLHPPFVQNVIVPFLQAMGSLR